MNRRTEAAIAALEDSGNSASVSLADHLNTVAGNGGESITTAAMHDEARAMIAACVSFLIDSGGRAPLVEQIAAIVLQTSQASAAQGDWLDEPDSRQAARKILQTLQGGF